MVMETGGEAREGALTWGFFRKERGNQEREPSMDGGPGESCPCTGDM